MAKLFLTSSIHAVAHDIAKKVDLSKGSELVFIDTPAEGKSGDKTWLANDRQSLVDAGFDVTDYTITGKTSSEIENALKDYNYIYMSGGDSPYMIRESRKSGFYEIIRRLINEKGKTYISTSAGSVLAGPKCPAYILDDDELEEFGNAEMFGFVNFTIVPHWGREDFRKKYLDVRLVKAYLEDQVPLIVLTDYQYLMVEDGSMEIISVKH